MRTKRKMKGERVGFERRRMRVWSSSLEEAIEGFGRTRGDCMRELEEERAGLYRN